MNTVERPEGFKEKRAEMVISKFEKISGGSPASPPAPVQQEFEEPDPDDIPF